MIEIRPIDVAEVRAMRETIFGVFGGDLGDDEEKLARADESFAALLDLERTAAAFGGHQLVAGSATFDLDLAVPGNTVAMGGLTMVAVMPSHRRRGILRRFIDAHLRGCAERGQAISGLWATEAPIYGRFGFGPAGDSEKLEIAADRVALPPDTGGDEVRLHVSAATDAAARDAAIAIHERVWPTRPGMFGRAPAWWQHRTFNLERPGASRNRARMAITRRGDELTGYVAYKCFPEFKDDRPAGRLEIIELIAADPIAEASLWRFVLDVDLFPNVRWWNAPVDSLGPYLTANRRCFKRTRADALWLRINDVCRALEARRYQVDGSLSLQIAGEPEVYELRVEEGGGRCEPATGEPDLVFDRDALGSIYLGGVRPSLLWRAGKIRGDAGAAQRADRMFAWSVVPWCPEIF